MSVWVLLLMFAKVTLTAHTEKSKPDLSNLTKTIKSRLARWRKGDYSKLWEEATRRTRIPPQSGRKKAPDPPAASQEEKNALRAVRLAQQGEYTRAVQSLTSAGLARPDRDTTRIMQSKHPQSARATAFRSSQSSPQMAFSQTTVMKATMSFRKGSAPGPDGLRAEHLRAATQHAPPNRRAKAEEALTKLVNTMVAGNVPDEVAPFLAGARLHAGNKKDGGIRPIAVGNILRRLTSKCSMSTVAERAASLLGPHQLGVGVKEGLEAIIHAARQATQEGDEDFLVLQVDFLNAFNMADREKAFVAMEEAFPDLIEWVLTCYNCEAKLIFGKTIILSQVGFHQGDPLAGLLFSLTLHPIIMKIQQRIQGLKLNTWYLDDGSLGGNKRQLQGAVDIILQEGPARGLFLSTARTVPPQAKPKSTVWSPCGVNLQDDPLDRGIPRVKEEGIILLGSPIGSQHFVDEAIRERISKVKTFLESLPLLQNGQVEYTLLRSCLSLPKFMYTMRTTETTDHQPLWQGVDCLIREAMSRILGVPLSTTQWLQAQLPVKMGGMGLFSTWDLAPAAYCTSYLAAHDLKLTILNKTQEESPPIISAGMLEYLSSKTGEDSTIDSLIGTSQSAVSLSIHLKKHQLLTQTIQGQGVVRETARLASVGLLHAGDWLNVMPSPTLGLAMDPAEFTVCVKYRLGVKVFSTAGKCPACPAMSDALGDHAISCGYAGERIARHDRLRDALFSTAQQGCLGPTREDRALLPGSDARPADVLIPNWTGGRDTALDITVVNPLQAAMVNQAAVTAGHGLTVAYDRKMTKAGEECRRAGMVFIPMPMETLGGWHEKTEMQVKKLASALARHTGGEQSETTRHLCQRLSILLARGNSALILNRQPNFPTAAEDGVE